MNDLQEGLQDASLDDMMAPDPYQVSNQMAIGFQAFLHFFSLKVDNTQSPHGTKKHVFFTKKPDPFTCFENLLHSEMIANPGLMMILPSSRSEWT